jgi:hypothetical protein
MQLVQWLDGVGGHARQRWRLGNGTWTAQQVRLGVGEVGASGPSGLVKWVQQVLLVLVKWVQLGLQD